MAAIAPREGGEEQGQGWKLVSAGHSVVPYNHRARAASSRVASMKTAKLPHLVKGVDYYIEAGKFVFTRAYHLKRGFCCNSRCRHCPYAADEGAPTRIEFSGLPVKIPG